MDDAVDWINAAWPYLVSGATIAGVMIAWLGLHRGQPADVRAKVQGAPSHDVYGRPTLRVYVENKDGPGIARKVRVTVSEPFIGPEGKRQRPPKPIHVAERLGPGQSEPVEIPASGDRLDMVKVRWRDGAGRQWINPDPPPPFIPPMWT